MAMVTYPLNNTEYYAEDAELYNSTRTSGVWSGEDFDFSADGTSTMVSVGEGLAWIKNSKFSGKVVAHKEAEMFDFGVSDPSYSRIDALAIRYDALENKTYLVVKKGTPSSNPEIPQRSTSETEYELFLFSVLRVAGSKTISNSDITDLRDDENYCGYMQNAVQSGYAPSLVERNKNRNFRFWVGSNGEYEEQKNGLPENTFCIVEDEVLSENLGEFQEEADFESAVFKIVSSMKANEQKFVRFLLFWLGNWSWFGTLIKTSDGYAILEASSGISSHASKINKTLSNNVWQPFEWENPPMLEGVEYRTVQKINNKPIYKKLVTYTNAEPLRGEQNISVPHNIDTLDMITYVKGFTANYILPYFSFDTSLVIGSYTKKNVVLVNKNSSWAAGRKWFFEIEYTKE